MATATVAIKNSLLGTEIEPDVSVQTIATFEKHARRDDSTGDTYMNEDDFVNAIAPTTENYVSFLASYIGIQMTDSDQFTA